MNHDITSIDSQEYELIIQERKIATINAILDRIAVISENLKDEIQEIKVILEKLKAEQ